MERFRRFTLIFSLFSLVFIGVAEAKKGKYSEKQRKAYDARLRKEAPVKYDPNRYKVDFEKLAKNLKKASKNRIPAEQKIDILQFEESEGFRKIRDGLFDLGNKVEGQELKDRADLVEEQISKMVENWHNYKNDARFLAAQIVPFRAFRGIVWKLRGVFENKSNVAHSTVLTWAKRMATRVNFYFPPHVTGGHIEVLYHYLTSPYYEDDGKIAKQFKHAIDIQIWAATKLQDEILIAKEILESFDLNSKPIRWDNKIVYGINSFNGSGENPRSAGANKVQNKYIKKTSDFRRYRLVDEFERQLALASVHSALASIHMFRAYNVDKSTELSVDIGKLFGFDGFLWETVQGVSAELVKIEIDKYPNIGTATDKHRESMKFAGEAIRSGVRIVKRVFDNLPNRDGYKENVYAFNTGYWRVNREDMGENLNHLDRIVKSKGVESLYSTVDGREIKINFNEMFFANPPRNLQVFLPQEFFSGDTTERNALFGPKGARKTKKTPPYRNYMVGSPDITHENAWDTKAYSTYFPSIQKGSDVDATLRVLSHAGGNWLKITAQ